MFEGDNISFLRIPSLCKLRWSCRCIESNSIWSVQLNLLREGEKVMIGWETANYFQSHLQFAFPLLVWDLSNNSCFTVAEFLCCVSSEVNEKRGGDKAYKEKYLVFEIGGCAARLKGRFGVSQDDTFSSSINHILEEGFQVRNIATHYLICDAYVFAWMFLHVFNYEIKR